MRRGSHRYTCTGIIIAALCMGCSSHEAVTPPSTSATTAKISPSLVNAVQQLENGRIRPPLTGPVRSDAQGNIQVYVHVTDTSAEHLTVLGRHGLQNMLASPALRIVQGWVQPQKLASLAALPFVVRITPPRYAIPR